MDYLNYFWKGGGYIFLEGELKISVIKKSLIHDEAVTLKLIIFICIVLSPYIIHTDTH